jgi:hypothetical protein
MYVSLVMYSLLQCEVQFEDVYIMVTTPSVTSVHLNLPRHFC